MSQIAVVRPAKENELKVVQDLNHDLFISDFENDALLNLSWPYKQGKKYFADHISGKTGVCFVAEVNGNIVGYVAGKIQKAELWTTARRAELENIFVKPTWRGKGVGRLLVEKMADWARKKEVNFLFLSVYAQNSKARSFYEKVGFGTVALTVERKLHG
jgi:ribosomal protein S18 acetylase RimI-like enzyme